MPFLSFPLLGLLFFVQFALLLKGNMRKITRQKGNATLKRQHKLLRALGTITKKRKTMQSNVETEKQLRVWLARCRRLAGEAALS